MKKHKFRKNCSNSALIFGTLLSVFSLLLSTLIFSFILSKLENPISLVGVGSLAALLTSAAISGFFTSKYKGEGGTVSAILSSLITCLLIFATGLIASGGKLGLSLLMNILCYLLVSSLFGKLASLKKRRRRRH